MLAIAFFPFFSPIFLFLVRFAQNKYRLVLCGAHMCSLLDKPNFNESHKHCIYCLLLQHHTTHAHIIRNLGGCVVCVQSLLLLCILARLTDGQRAKNEIYYQSFICYCSNTVSGQINRCACARTQTHTYTNRYI